MLMHNWFNLDLNFLPLEDMNLIYSYDQDKSQAISLGYDSISQECKLWMNENNFKFYRLLLFILPPNFKNQEIHIDGDGPGAITYAVNWNLNSNNFSMNWYREKMPGVKLKSSASADTIRYIKFQPDEVELIETASSRGPLLFNTRIPHNVHNLDNNVRFGLSLRFVEQYDSWADTTSVFQKWII